MAKKIDKRKYKVPSLRLKAKHKPSEKCRNCIRFRNKNLGKFSKGLKEYGKCTLYNIRVRKDELCDSFSADYLSRDLGVTGKGHRDDVKKYNTLGFKGVSIELSGGVIEEKQYVPLITKSDYDKGFIDRKFVQRRSHRDNPILEVKDFSQYPAKYYLQVDLEWKITGPRRHDNYSEDGLLLEKSIYNFNRDSIKYATKKISGMRFKVTNFTFLAYQKQNIGQVDHEEIETTVQNVYRGRKNKS